MTENLSSPLWAAEQAALVRGLAHALSNRVGTVVAVGGMLAPGAPAPAMVVGMLQDEGGRLEELLALMRLLAGEGDDAGPEPIHLPDIVTPVVALHGHHPALRDVPVTVADDADAPPVRARRDELVRALLVRLSAAKRDAADAVSITWRRDGSDVEVVVRGASDHVVRVPAL